MEQVKLFHTCKSMEELSTFVRQFNGTEGIVAITVYMVTINTINKLYDTMEKGE